MHRYHVTCPDCGHEFEFKPLEKRVLAVKYAMDNPDKTYREIAKKFYIAESTIKIWFSGKVFRKPGKK